MSVLALLPKIESVISLIRTWAPILKQNDEPTLSLLVKCGKEAPNREQYRVLLETAINSLILENPKQARQDLKMVSPEDSPGLSNILAEFQPSEWATQIMLSPQMAMLLNRIDWQKTSPVKERSAADLPSLLEILEMLP